MIARMQRMSVAWLVALAVGWWWCMHPGAWAWVGVLAVVWWHAIFLAFEFTCMQVVNRRDPAPRATLAHVVGAWLRETLTAPQVFYWRQPFRAHAEPDNLPAAPAASTAPQVRGVVLIHGLVCNRGFWTPWLRRLRAMGRPFIAINLEPVFGDIDDYAPQIDAAVRRMADATGLSPILVCHSMGGLAARAWLRTAGAEGRAHRIITIGSPHHGTWLGQFTRSVNGVQMRHGGAWIAQLQQDAQPAHGGRFTCWYSNCDNIVFPASTGALPGATNRFVAGVGHVALATHPAVLEASLQEIAQS